MKKKPTKKLIVEDAKGRILPIPIAGLYEHAFSTPPAPLGPFAAHANPRMIRLVRALLRAPVWRKEADRVAKCANSPDLISHIRRLGLGRANLGCTRHKLIDSDGKKTHPGLYWLTPLGHAMLTDWLNSLVVAPADETAK